MSTRKKVREEGIKKKIMKRILKRTKRYKDESVHRVPVALWSHHYHVWAVDKTFDGGARKGAWGPHVMVFGITNTLSLLHKLWLSRGEREGWASFRSRVDGRSGDGGCESVELLQQRPLWDNSQYECIYTHNTSTRKYTFMSTLHTFIWTQILKRHTHTITHNHT